MTTKVDDDHLETLRIYFYLILHRRSTLRSHDALGSEETTDYCYASPTPMTWLRALRIWPYVLNFGVRIRWKTDEADPYGGKIEQLSHFLDG